MTPKPFDYSLTLLKKKTIKMPPKQINKTKLPLNQTALCSLEGALFKVYCVEQYSWVFNEICL